MAPLLAKIRSLISGASMTPAPAGAGGWTPLGPLTIREPYTGAWQRNAELSADTALSYSAVYACVSLIASDIAKCRLRLVAQDANGIWTETKNAAYSPVLRKPNRYQTIIKFVEGWITSKLVHGNAYALKQRDARGVVTALYPLDPLRVLPLVAPDGGVYYQLTPQRGTQDLAGVGTEVVVVPARELIHDLMIALFHPLVGVSPLYACGVSALQGQTIQNNSSKFFANGSNPGGILLAPGAIDDAQAARLKKRWEERYAGPDNIGRVAVLGDNLKYEPLTMSAVDAQLIDQLKWTADTICSVYHVPPYMVGIGAPPPYANIEPLVQQYYNSCLQTLFACFELSMDEGLELIAPYGTEFDIDDLIWMDAATRTKSAHDAINAGALSPNEARKKYFGLGPVAGGDSPYLQVQNYSLEALAARDDAAINPPDPPPAAPPPPPPGSEDDEDDDEDEGAEFEAAFVAVQRHALSEGLYDG